MIGEILNALLLECRKKLEGTAATIILKTDYKGTDLATYNMPLLLLDVIGGDESRMFLGGCTSADWSFGFNVYSYEPDSNQSDPSAYSTGLINFIDQIRQHFSFGVWLTQGMRDIESNYGFRFTLTGILGAPALDQDGLIMGYQIRMESMAIDESTAGIELSSEVLEHVVQVNNPPFDV